MKKTRAIAKKKNRIEAKQVEKRGWEANPKAVGNHARTCANATVGINFCLQMLFMLTLPLVAHRVCTNAQSSRGA